MNPYPKERILDEIEEGNQSPPETLTAPIEMEREHDEDELPLPRISSPWSLDSEQRYYFDRHHRRNVIAAAAAPELSRSAKRSSVGSMQTDRHTNTPHTANWWSSMTSFRSKRKRIAEEEEDHDVYIRAVFESYTSSISSNRFSTFCNNNTYRNSYECPMRSVTAIDGEETGGGMYATATGTEREQYRLSWEPSTAMVVSPRKRRSLFEDDEEMMLEEELLHADEVEEDEQEKSQRRVQRRITQETMRAKLLLKAHHRARTRKKRMIFILCIGMTWTVFVTVAILIANAGVETKNVKTNGGRPVRIERLNTSHSKLPELSGRSALDLINKKNTTSPSSAFEPREPLIRSQPVTSNMAACIYMYVHCLLMSLSLWMSLVVIGMHYTFRTFRTYSMPLVVELSIIQCGYWMAQLFRIQVTTRMMSPLVSQVFCFIECFFNFGQISFTCAIAFNMYRSVVSYADVLMDTHHAQRRYRVYTLNVMVLSLIASVLLALVGYHHHKIEEEVEACISPLCQLILNVYYPLLAFSFNFIFYIRFKRTIGGAYPVSATGRLNTVAISYLVLFFICWGSVMVMTILQRSTDVPQRILFGLQCTFDVLGIGTALITLVNFYRCRRAFDFGLSLKAIDPHSIEFEDPVRILGEGTFALVLKAKWHQRIVESSISKTVDVAVKTFKHTQFETLEHMKEEAYLASKLVHPCVMMTYGCYTIGINLYIVSECLSGGTLQDVVDTQSSLSYEMALRYAHMIANGMRFLHGLPVPIIHRDLKPLNCIFDADQQVLKIADFGASRLFRNEGKLTQPSHFYPTADLTLQMTTNIGSACWAAPEVLKDEARSEYSLKIDVYSFGIMCWQLYTCQVPYLNIPGSVLAVSEAVIAGTRPEIPSDCPTLFAKIMRRCWHEDPLRRPSFEDIAPLLEIEMADVEKKREGQDSRRSSRSSSKRSSRRTKLQSTTQI